MSSKEDAVEHVQKGFKDAETLRKEEWKRRRLLRLEQVRQQSKDIANLVRQKVQGEREKQLGLCEERVNAKTQQWQVRRLKALESEYESTLKNVGKGHAQAASQPNVEALKKEETEKILAAAQKRGQEALNRLKEEEANRRKADEERRSQLLHVRAIEESRSAAVVALPAPESTVGIKSLPSKKSVYTPCKSHESIGLKAKKSDVPEWPKKSWPLSTLPLGIIPAEQGDSLGVHHNSYESAVKHPTSVQISSHGDSSRGIEQINSQQTNSSISHKTSKETLIRNPGASTFTSDVKLYDYTSCYQSQYDKTSGIVEKVQAEGKINANEAAERETLTQTVPGAGSVQREQQRSRDAVQRVLVQRDYKQLMGNLSVLAKQNAALQCFASKSESKSKGSNQKLIVAIENLIEDGKTHTSELLDSSSATSTDGSMIVSRLEDSPASVPKLNVGRWHPPSPSTEQASYPVNDSPSSGSIVVAPPSTVSLVQLSDRQDTVERDTALRSLVQRINQERQSLLLSSQQQLNHSEHDIQDGLKRQDREMDIRNYLAERVLQQRQDLQAQRSEVKRLNASIVTPDCTKQRRDQTMNESPDSSSRTHESIIIEPSNSEESQGRTSFAPAIIHENSMETKRKRAQSFTSTRDGKTRISSPSKEGMMYVMDVSLSSVIMDKSENSSSSSKSLSVHGVQVSVKVCGTEEDSSETSSISVSNAENLHPKVTELSIDDSDAKNGDKHFENHHRTRKNSEKEKGKKVKAVEKHISDPSKLKGTKHVNEMSSKSIKQDKSIHKPHTKKKKEFISMNNDGASLYHDKQKKKSDSEQKEKNNQIIQKEKATDDADQPTSSSTSYLSPPDRVLSSLTEDIKTLIALAQGEESFRKEIHSQQIHQNPPLARYINRLLAMSRESIDRLNVSCSEVSTPPSAIFHSTGTDSELDENVTDLVNAPPVPDQASQRDNISSGQVEKSAVLLQSIADESHWNSRVPQADGDHGLPPSLNDQGVLSEMTRQCHEKISALTKMIEDVRKDALENSSTNNQSNHSSHYYNQSRSPQPLDSTAYMSPPPIVFPPQSDNSTDNRVSLDPYGAAVLQLLAEVRSHLTSKPAETLESSNASFSGRSPKDEPDKPVGFSEPWQPRSKPPVAFWRNIERCNVTSPTEPHELSTIPELGTTLPESLGSQLIDPDSPFHTLSSPSTPGTPPDVIAELLRRNLLTSPFSWAKKKEIDSGSKDKPSLSSDSNISPRNNQDSDLSSGKTGSGQSDISASKETNTVSMLSQNSMSNSSKDWKTNMMMSPADLYSSADEVEVDFRRMGIGWVGAMLRKTKEAGALSSTSSSDNSPLKIDHNHFKDLKERTIDDEPILSSSLVVSVQQGRSHSTPVKHPSDLGSSSGSHLS